MEHLDEGRFEAGDLQSFLDPLDEPHRLDLAAAVLEQSTNEVGPRLRVCNESLPQVVVTLLLGKVDGQLDVTEPLDDELERFEVVAHPPEKEDRLVHVVLLLRNAEGALEVVEVARAEEGHQPGVVVLSVQLHLEMLAQVHCATHHSVRVLLTRLRVLVEEHVEVHVQVLRLGLKLLHDTVDRDGERVVHE